MKGYIKIEIPVKKYIKAYLIKELGKEPKISKSGHHVEQKLYDLLEHHQNHQRNLIPCNYSDSIRFFIALETFKRRGHHLNHSNIRQFNRYVEKIIKSRFYELMTDGMEILPNFLANLPEVRRKLGIDIEAWSDDSMKKDYYRYRINYSKKKTDTLKNFW